MDKKEIINQLERLRAEATEYQTALEEAIDTLEQVWNIGKWTRLGEDEYRCSACGKVIFIEHEEDKECCPNCGADMRGGMI